MINLFMGMCLGACAFFCQPRRNIRPTVGRTKLQRTSKSQVDKEAEEKLNVFGCQDNQGTECFKEEKMLRTVICCFIGSYVYLLPVLFAQNAQFDT